MSISGLIASYGYRAVFALVVAGSLGIPRPGDTVLIIAAAYAGHPSAVAVDHLRRGVGGHGHRRQHRLLDRPQGRLLPGPQIRAQGAPG